MKNVHSKNVKIAQIIMETHVRNLDIVFNFPSLNKG